MKNKFLSGLLLIVTVFSCTDHPKKIAVSTYAGNGTMGFHDGSRLEASFSNLTALAMDSKGNLYVADSRNNAIRKISSNGIVTTLAGSGKVGSADGKGNEASFFYPTALAVDVHGNVFVADTHNNRIRKISPEGMVTTIAGKATLLFDNPCGIAVDPAGNIFVSDWHDQIRKISPAGDVTNFAGSGSRGAKDGEGSRASFYIPQGMVFDKEGNLFVADSYNNQIREISPAGTVTTFAGRIKKGSANGRIDSASFFHPNGIAINKNGDIFVADTGNDLIRIISKDHQVATVAGTGSRGSTNGGIAMATFWRPMGIAVDSSGNVFVADYQNKVVRKIGY